MSEKIKLFLREKIEETKQNYIIGFPNEIGIIQIRNYLFTIIPINYDKSADRIGADKVSFALKHTNESGEVYRTTISFHISPERKGDPAVSGWIEGRDGNFGWQKIDDRFFEAFKISKMNHWEFYKFWIERFCKKNDSEIFKFKRKIK